MGRMTPSPASRSLDVKPDRRRRRKPAVTSTPCPVCVYPIRDHDVDVVECGRCGAMAHGPCFWRTLPMEEWQRYIRRRQESSPSRTVDRGLICARCRRARRGVGVMTKLRKPLARMSTESLARARDAECVCSHRYGHHRQEQSRIATVCERCSCVGFTPRHQRAWDRLLAGSR